MANSDKNIKITPNISQAAQPNVVFTGQGNVPITLKVLDDSFGTLSFEGSAGQLFSVNNNLSTGVIFSVNDISGIPQIDVNADGTIRLAPFGGAVQLAGMNIGLGLGSIFTNTAFGSSALAANTTGSQNTAIGYFALKVNTTALANTAVGYLALSSAVSSASYNAAFGANSLQNASSGNSNAAFGCNSLTAITTGSANTGLGQGAGQNYTTGSNNVSIGYEGGRFQADGSTLLTTPANSIYIGVSSRGLNNSDSNSIVIGYQAIGKGANTTVIGNTSTTTTYLYGETSYIGGVAGTAISIQPQTRSTTGAGANVTIAAGAGVTTGAGGSIILQPGAQATSGGNGVVIVRQPGGTAGTDEIQMYHDGTDGYVASKDGHLILRAQNSYIKLQDSTGAASVRLNLTSTGNGTLYIDSCYQIYLSPSTSIRSDVIHIFGSSSQNFFSSSGIGLQNTAYLNFYTGAYYNTSADSGFVRGGVGQIRVTDGSTGGGSLAFTSSSPSGYAANQDNLVLTGSAFQRLSGTAARDITGVAPPSGGSHVDGRMMRIYNVGSFNLTLKHNSASSTAANRFFCIQSVDIIVSANDFAELIYDSTNNGSGAAGWRVA